MSSAGPRDVTKWAQSSTATNTQALYDQDEFGWLLQQADLLRAGRLDEIDQNSLAEFLTDMAKSDLRSFESAMAILLQHMLKVLMQPEKLTRSWTHSITVQQIEAQRIVRTQPGMRQFLPDLYVTAYPDARKLASSETGIALSQFPLANPWTMDEALAYVPPEPALPGNKFKRRRKRGVGFE